MNYRLGRNGDTSVEWIVWVGIFAFLGTTGWMLYEFYVMRKVRKGLREQVTINEVALLVRMRNAAIVAMLYSLSFVSFLHFSLTRLSEEHEQYHTRLHAVEFLTGIGIAAVGLALASHVMQYTVITRLKQRVRQRAWTLKFWRGRQKARHDNLVSHDS